MSDPTRAFTGEEWETLRYNGGQAYVLQARDRINNARGGRGRGNGQQGRGYQQRNAAAIHTDANGTIVSDITNDQTANTANNRGQGGASERGSQNGRGFGRGAYHQGRGRGGRY